MKKLERKIEKPAKNYLKIETSGLSREIDSIVAMSIAKKNSEILESFYIENLKDERKLLEETLPILSEKEFVTYSGKSFDLPFIREKVKFYFNKDLDFNLIDLQEITKKYNFIFNLESHSNKVLIDKFIGQENLRDQNDYEGIKIKTLFKKYLEGEKAAIDKILDYNFISLKNLILLDLKINEKLKKNLSFEVLKSTFLIENMKLLDNTIEICGSTNYNKDWFSTNEKYTFEINGFKLREKIVELENFCESEKICESEKFYESSKNYKSQKIYESIKNKKLDKEFSLKINTEDGLYDGKTSCYYVKKKNLDFALTNPSKIKSPEQIQILYYKNHVFKNEKELIEKIIEKELGE
ncbi:ribonuclease H-like domain-containing protein [Peptoniphilus senegalensis]|uniref:Ribonuclease H-like domain-containing protein n=1 Tax=Peptoniphilus senegalensis TaxID=1465757 RepID=A0ABV1J2P8_9FIRM